MPRLGNDHSLRAACEPTSSRIDRCRGAPSGASAQSRFDGPLFSGAGDPLWRRDASRPGESTHFLRTRAQRPLDVTPVIRRRVAAGVGTASPGQDGGGGTALSRDGECRSGAWAIAARSAHPCGFFAVWGLVHVHVPARARSSLARRSCGRPPDDVSEGCG
jgi:hypothetical protein